jgi:hypothetical protein
VRKLLRDLPEGDPHKIERPPGHPSTWPQVLPHQSVEEGAA